MKKISLIPYVCGVGASVPGSEQGPLYSYSHGLCDILKASGLDVEWVADPENIWKSQIGELAHELLANKNISDTASQRLQIVQAHSKILAENILNELQAKRRVVTLGGDHTLSVGSVAGVQAAFGTEAKLGLLWIDAHPDIHTFKSSASKALHGMPLATLTGLDDTLALENFPVRLKPENIVFAGLRDIDAGEFENASSLGINLLNMDELRAGGIEKTLKDATAKLAEKCDQIILSIDLDAFSIEQAPSVGSPVPGGFVVDEILPVLADIVRTYPVPLIDIVEFNPMLPKAEKTLGLLIRILDELLPRLSKN